MKTYIVNEIFYSLQGEGVRAGTPNYFVRFTGCNLKCDVTAGPLSPGGFSCDTEFTSGRRMTATEIWEECLRLNQECEGVIFTGGEPLLQLDEELLTPFKKAEVLTAVETNGTISPETVIPNPAWLDWITLSPKVAEHAIKCRNCTELKYVRNYGQGVPVTSVIALHHLISPAFSGNQPDARALEWCIKLCLENPTWRLSVQQHKMWRVR